MMSRRATTNFSAGHGGMPAGTMIRTVVIEKATGVSFTYVRYKGGVEVATQLVGIS